LGRIEGDHIDIVERPVAFNGDEVFLVRASVMGREGLIGSIGCSDLREPGRRCGG
jgi:hypothetical protein